MILHVRIFEWTGWARKFVALWLRNGYFLIWKRLQAIMFCSSIDHKSRVLYVMYFKWWELINVQTTYVCHKLAPIIDPFNLLRSKGPKQIATNKTCAAVMKRGGISCIGLLRLIKTSRLILRGSKSTPRATFLLNNSFSTVAFNQDIYYLTRYRRSANCIRFFGRKRCTQLIKHIGCVSNYFWV